MEAVIVKLPHLLEEDQLLRLPATWEEYGDLADDTQYTIQYLNGEIIVSQATDSHETLVATIIWLFNNLYMDQADYRVMGSNVKIAIDGVDSDLNADVMVIRGPSEYGTTPKGNPSAQVKNPLIIVEVLSKSTRKFDQGEKMNYYKLIPSLQHILFVDQVQPFASVYSRTDVADEWLNHDYRTLDTTVQLGMLAMPMSAIYQKTAFRPTV